MALGAFLRRDLIASTRQRKIFSDRLHGVILLSAVILAEDSVSDILGWERP